MLTKIHVLSPSVVSGSFATPLTVAHQVLCPLNFPDKNNGVTCHFLIQGIFPTHLLHLLHRQVGSLLLSHDRVNSIKIQQS